MVFYLTFAAGAVTAFFLSGRYYRRINRELKEKERAALAMAKQFQERELKERQRAQAREAGRVVSEKGAQEVIRELERRGWIREGGK